MIGIPVMKELNYFTISQEISLTSFKQYIISILPWKSQKTILEIMEWNIDLKQAKMIPS